MGRTVRRLRSGLLYATGLVALYFGGGFLVREWAAARLAHLEAGAEARWVGAKMRWTFVDAQGRAHSLDAPHPRRRIVLVGVENCARCLAQQREAVRILRTPSATPRDVEVWVASTKVVFVEHMEETDVAVIPMRHQSVDLTLAGEAAALPLMIEVDTGGIVRGLSVGFVAGRGSKELASALNPNPSLRR